MTMVDANHQAALAAEASRVRASGDLGRSKPLLRLFDFLLERSLVGSVPKEIEVAQQVFDKSGDFDMASDASVRVYVHRLRRKIEEHYRGRSDACDPISIPLGTYRFALASEATAKKDDASKAGTIRTSWSGRRFWLALGLFLLVNGLGWMYFGGRPANRDVATSNLWRPIMDSRRPTLIVAGDYYMFAEAPNGFEVTRLVRDFAINSQENLDEYLMSHPQDMDRYLDVNLHYLPASMAGAMRNLIPAINDAAASSGIRPRSSNMSEVRPEQLKNANIIYIGFLSGLGLLHNPVFQAAGFKVGDNFDQLIDKASGRKYLSDWAVVANGKVPQRDYGYISSLPGPSGNRILVIAGTRDAALSQMAEVATDRAQLAAIDMTSGKGAFEALFEVRTLGNLNLGSKLLLARPIKADHIWEASQAGDDANKRSD